MIDQPTADDVLARLAPLVGEWRFVQRTAAGRPDAPKTLSIMGCDAGNDTYYQLYSDDRGVCRVYAMSIDETEWKLWREGAPFSQRFTGRFEDGAGGSPAAGRGPTTASTTRPTST